MRAGTPSQTTVHYADEELDLCGRFGNAPAGREALRRYVEQEYPHLLRAYDADFLVQAIERAKSR